MEDPFWEFAKRAIGRMVYTVVMTSSIFFISILISVFVTSITGDYELGASAFLISFIVLLILAIIHRITLEFSEKGDSR